eukprot:9149873-Alexandrium_andersonii.AAC.1
MVCRVSPGLLSCDLHSPPHGFVALFGVDAGCTRVDSIALAVRHTLPYNRLDHAIRPIAPVPQCMGCVQRST